MNKNLYVVTSLYNPCRYNSRVKLYNEFRKYVQDSGANLFTVEIAFGDRPFAVTTGKKNELQLVTNSEMWHKERAINLAIQHLPRDWEYFAWIDADTIFTRKDWVRETVELLQHYKVIQMFSKAIDLSPDSEPISTHNGLIYSYLNNLIENGKDYLHHPGYAWAGTRYFIDSVGGLFDYSILGSGDRFMALSFMDKHESAFPDGLSVGYHSRINIWNDRCQKYINKNVGYMPGSIIHYWHGKKADRKYWDRWDILKNNNYDPEFDIKPDWQGLWQYTNRETQLRYDIKNYFSGRNEDSIDL